MNASRHFVLRQVSAYMQKYEEYGLAVLGIKRSQSIFDFLKNKQIHHTFYSSSNIIINKYKHNAILKLFNKS